MVEREGREGRLNCRLCKDLGTLKKDISFALRRDTIAQVTTALDAAQSAVEDELALNEAGSDR